MKTLSLVETTYCWYADLSLSYWSAALSTIMTNKILHCSLSNYRRRQDPTETFPLGYLGPGKPCNLMAT